MQQTYPHWHATIIVDCATDSTAELLSEYIIRYDLQDQVTLIVNQKEVVRLQTSIMQQRHVHHIK